MINQKHMNIMCCDDQNWQNLSTEYEFIKNFSIED